jgi:hypothetical protein
MEDFERQLRDALARKEQPPTFDSKVFAAIAAGSSKRWVFWRWGPWRWEAVAASVLVLAAFWAQREQALHERAAGEAAKARLEVALKITVVKLSKIQRTVRTSTEE